MAGLQEREGLVLARRLGGGSLKPSPFRSNIVRDAALVGPDLRSEAIGNTASPARTSSGGGATWK